MYIFVQDYEESYWIIKNPKITTYEIRGYLVQTNQDQFDYSPEIKNNFVLYRTHPVRKIENIKPIKLVKYKIYKSLKSLINYNFMELL